MKRTADENRYSMTIEWQPDGGIYVVTVPELPGCFSQGSTYEEAVKNGDEAIADWIEIRRSLGQSVPLPRQGIDALPDFLPWSELTHLAPGEDVTYDQYSMDLVWQPDDRTWAVTVRELPGCQTHGATRQEAIAQGRAVIRRWIDAFRIGRPIPRPSFHTAERAEATA